MYVHSDRHAHIRTHIRTRICTYTHNCVCMCIYSTARCVYAHVCTRMSTYTLSYSLTHIREYAHLHLSLICTHPHLYECISIFVAKDVYIYAHLNPRICIYSHLYMCLAPIKTECTMVTFNPRVLPLWAFAHSVALLRTACTRSVANALRTACTRSVANAQTLLLWRIYITTRVIHCTWSSHRLYFDFTSSRHRLAEQYLEPFAAI